MILSPVARLDTIAQVTILLGAVTHFVVGLSGKSCNFIIVVIMMLVQMSMARSISSKISNLEHYPVDQSTVLQQLPSSMSQELRYFDLDSVTTVYTACPTCNFTHNSIYD